MVHKILKTYLPAISMSFTVIILLAGIVKWILEEKQDIFALFAFEVVAYLILTCILDELIGRINFKTYISHFITESILIYPITMLFAIKFRWIGMSAVNIIFCSAAYFSVMVGIHLYFYCIEKGSVAEMNRLLEEGRDKNG
ncbi:hypothetical protein EDD76_11652 [Kineothrix alysoides]|uniref:DUF3021 family protein n=1 Tax=Kineothrix alysoides TaxID=1469948 RepID=A0A4V2QB65_9FIRM|nr:hypothetical protein [Kineothrix alysoides]TCL55212.1 hypothetical protein EDD76_11652 [Kineothrix alysoides]